LESRRVISMEIAAEGHSLEKAAVEGSLVLAEI
jgi:hypothetical protein